MVQAAPRPRAGPQSGCLPTPRGAVRPASGGVSKEITAAHAARILEQVTPSGPVAAVRRDLAAQSLEDLRGLDAQLRDTKKKLAAAVRASGTSLTEVFGFGPVNTGTVIGDVTDVTRFPSRDHFASYNGTAPVEVSSGNRKIYRLSLRGNRRINHALHMAAITQIRHAHSDGRAYYDRKIAEGKTHKEALRCLKRRISDAVFARLQADARKATVTAAAKGPGGQPGNGSDSSAAGSHPERQLFYLTSGRFILVLPASPLHPGIGYVPDKPAPAPADRLHDQVLRPAADFLQIWLRIDGSVPAQSGARRAPKGV